MIIGSGSYVRLQAKQKPKREAHKDTQIIKSLLDESVRRTEDPALEIEERTQQYLIMIGALYILSKIEGAKYKTMLGLTLFNYPAPDRDPYFRMAFTIFRKMPGLKAKLRAAYSAYSIHDLDAAKEIFDSIRYELPKVKLTEVEKTISKKLLHAFPS